MNIYKVYPDLAYSRLVFATAPTKPGMSEDQQILARQNEYGEWRNRCETTGWVPPRLGNAGGNKAHVLPLDCIAVALGAPHGMLLNAHARALLAPLLAPNGRYLPVLWDGGDYQIFECTRVADIADQDGIEGVRYDRVHDPLNCWSEIRRWSFHPDRVACAPAIFTVPQKHRIMMCTDVLRDAVAEHDLLGFEFELLWSAEEGGVEIDTSAARFFGEARRRINIEGKERRRAMLATLKARAKAAKAKP